MKKHKDNSKDIIIKKEYNELPQSKQELYFKQYQRCESVWVNCGIQQCEVAGHIRFIYCLISNITPAISDGEKQKIFTSFNQASTDTKTPAYLKYAETNEAINNYVSIGEITTPYKEVEKLAEESSAFLDDCKEASNWAKQAVDGFKNRLLKETDGAYYLGFIDGANCDKEQSNKAVIELLEKEIELWINTINNTSGSLKLLYKAKSEALTDILKQVKELK